MIQEAVQATIDFLRGRKAAYQRVFLNSEAGETVLEDLASFCRANQTTFHADPRIHAVLEGRREVFLRIQQHLGLSGEQLFSLYSGNPPATTKED